MPNSAITQQVQGLASATSPGLVGTGAQTFAGAKTFQDGLIPPQSMMFRNKLINGAMLIDQRNSGASKTPVDGEYTLDRWRTGASAASKFSVQQVSTAPVGFSNSLQCTSLSAYAVTTNDNFEIFQYIEGFNTFDLGFGTANAKTITLSFWVRSSLTGSFGGSILNSAFNRSYPFTYTISTANTWEYKTVTIQGDTTGTWIGATNGAGLILCLGLGAGTGRSGTAGAWAASTFYNATGATSIVGTNGATILFSGVQLETGSVATPFEYRPVGTELGLCQRYAYVASDGDGIGGQAPTATEVQVRFKFPMTMRTIPAASLATSGSWVITTDLIDVTASTVIAGVVTGSSGNQARVRLGGFSGLTIGTTTYWSGGGALGTARLLFSAEL